MMIAETIAPGLGIPLRSIAEAEAEAAAHFDWLAPFAAFDNPTSSTITRTTMEWISQQLGLLDDIRANGYFQNVYLSRMETFHWDRNE